MKKKLIIERLKDTIEMLKGLNPEQFAYENYVSAYNPIHNCGTICCAVGWYPKFFPDAGIRWCNDLLSGNLKTELSVGVSSALSYWHGLNITTIDSLFYGDESDLLSDVSCCMSEVSIEQVIARFETVLNFVSENNDLDL